MDNKQFSDTLLAEIDEAEVICSAHTIGEPIQPLYCLVDARTGLSAGCNPLPCLIQAADGGLFHISYQTASQRQAAPDLPPINEDYVKVLDDLYPKDSPQRIVLGEVPFFISIPKGSSPPDGYTVYPRHPPNACNFLRYNRHHHLICVHHTSKFAPRQTRHPHIGIAELPEYIIPFQNKEDALISGLIKDIIKRSINKTLVTPRLSKQQLYAPIVHLCNTSGSGKTRTALELGKYTNVIYMKYGGNNGTAESVTASFLLMFIRDRCRNLKYVECYLIQHAVLQRLLYICCQYCQATSYMEGSIEIDHAVKWFCKSDILSDNILYYDVFGGIKTQTIDVRTSTGKLEGMLESSDEMSFDGKSLADIERLNLEWLKGRATSMPLRQESSKKECDNLKHLPNLVFVFDDAFSPMEKSALDESIGAINFFDSEKAGGTVTDCYKILRGTLRHYDFYWEETLSITVSSVVNYTPFRPPLYKKRNFRTLWGYDDIPTITPIVLTGSFDAFNHGTVSSNDFKDWLSFIFGFERCLMIASCGRPLWAVEYRMKIGKMIKQLWDERLDFRGYDIQLMKNDAFNFLPQDSNFGLAASKISPNIKLTDYGITTSIDDNTLVSLLSLSIAMTKFPFTVNSAELVRTGGMCLFDIDSENFKAVFVSEGIFNGIASYVVVRYFNRIVDYLCKLFAKGSFAFIMKSEVGEIIERLLIIYSAVKARRSGLCKALGCCEEMKTAKNICRTVFEPVGLADFLVEYVGKKATDKYMESCPGLEGSFVAFNHFDYMGGDDVADSPYDAVANYLSRGAALVSRSCTTILPLVLSDGRLSFVYIQTKMGSSQPYLKLPNVGDVSMSSPLNRWRAFFSGDLGNWDQNTPIPPYAYIYHHINCSEYEFAVIDGPLDKHQQPCLAFSGIHANDLESRASVTRLIRLFEGMEVEPWLAKNSSMLRTWKPPSKGSYVPVDWENHVLSPDLCHSDSDE